MQSLAGRLAFSITLFGLSTSVAAVPNVDWPTLAWMLRVSAILGLVGLLALLITRKALRESKPV